MSGHWPPEWDDPEEEAEFPGPAGQLDPTVLAEDREAQLSEVAAYLASVPVPVLPDAVESRISAALTAEDAARPRLPAPLPRPAPARARRRRRMAGDHRRQSDGRRRGDFLRRPAVNVGLLVVCLGLAGVGFALAQGGGQESFSSSVAAGSAAVPSATANAAGSGAAGSSGISSSSASSASGAVEAGPRASSAAAPDFGSVTFSVTASGTKYERATLAEQVRARVAGSPASLGAATLSTDLRGCVLHLTGGASPRLVDRATYQGEPAYVIASSTRVWVVGLGCTAAKTELVVSVALAGLPGNLRALISVEQ
jgi:hypothetical protein